MDMSWLLLLCFRPHSLWHQFTIHWQHQQMKSFNKRNFIQSAWCHLCGRVWLQPKLGPDAYCNSGSSSLCNSLSCFFAYTVKKIVVATANEKPTTVKIICGAERPWCSCEASANVRIKIPLQSKWEEFPSEQYVSDE